MTYRPSRRIIAGGQAPLEILDLGPNPGGRWQARLRGRSCGGYLVGRGDTIALALTDLRRHYQQELASIDAGEQDLQAMGLLRGKR